MNWKFIFKLSIFGLAMALLTLSMIPMKIEPFCWLAIFVLCAYLIPKYVSGNYFMHGFMTSILNCVWITSIHFIFYRQYLVNHPGMAGTINNTAFNLSPRALMLLTGPLIGFLSGLILGTFTLIAAKVQGQKNFAKDAAGTA